MNKVREKFWEKYGLELLNQEEWETLCDGCGKCCLIKIQKKSKLYLTNIACVQIDLKSCRCTNYKDRTKLVKDCVNLTQKNFKANLNWLPYTCSYKIVYEKKSLPPWHHLISKDNNTVHQKGFSIQNNCAHQSKIKEKNFDKYIIAEIET